MKALSLWQPWASLWACTDLKLHETRHWRTDRRGWLLVHAAKINVCSALDKGFTRDAESQARMLNILIDEWGGHWARDLPHGAIVGAVYLSAIFSTEDVVRVGIKAEDQLLGNFDAGRFAWRKAGHVAFERPIPYKGRQNFFEVPDDVVAGLVPEGRRA